MKRILSAALAFAMSTAVFTVPVSAHEQTAEEGMTTEMRVISRQTVEEQELKGIVKEVRDFELVVEDSEGQEYIVPIAAFKDIEEYKDANIKSGDKIELKGNEISNANINYIAVEPLDLIELEEASPVKHVAEDLTIKPAAKIVVNVAEEDKALEEAPLTLIDSIKAVETVRAATINRAAIELKEGSQMLEKAPMLTIQAAPIEGNIFLANEITVNDITITFSQVMEAAPALIKIEK